MELKGKKLLFLGDSITEGAGTSSIEHVYWRVLGARAGAEVVGYGIGGTRIARQLHPDDPHRDQHFASRVEGMDPQTDVVVVFGGTNDYGHGDAPLGTMADREDSSFFGALHTLCRKLIERYPAATIVFMTPTHRLDENRAVNEFGVRNVATLGGYAAAVKQVAAYYALPVLDLQAVSGLQPEVPVLRERYMPDGLHPNDAGNALIAERLQNFLQAL